MTAHCSMSMTDCSMFRVPVPASSYLGRAMFAFSHFRRRAACTPPAPPHRTPWTPASVIPRFSELLSGQYNVMLMNFGQRRWRHGWQWAGEERSRSQSTEPTICNLALSAKYLSVTQIDRAA